MSKQDADAAIDDARANDDAYVLAAHTAETPDAWLTAALALAQAEFPVITKDKTAEVRGKEGKAGYTYTYADLGDVLAAVRPVLARYGLALTQRTKRIDNGKTLLLTELRHVGGGLLDSECELGQSPGNPQAFGGALTYLRRYEAVTLLGIAAEEDRDAQDVEPSRNGNRAPEVPGWAQAASDDRKKQALEALAPMIGHGRAMNLLKNTAEHWGVFPDGITGFVKALGTHYVASQQKGAREQSPEAAEAAAADAAEAPQEAPQEEPPADAGRAPAEEFPPDSIEPDDERAPGLCKCPGGFAAAQAEGAERDDSCPVKGHGIPF